MWCPLARRTANLVSVRLHAFEALKGIVQATGRRVHLNRSVRNDFRSGPAVLRGPVAFQHVVRESSAEDEIFLGHAVELVRVTAAKLGCRVPLDCQLGSVDLALEY
jgi:hypothetical protein